MPTLAANKRARFDYDLLETFQAGLSLLGTEVKSVRAGHINLNGAFITFLRHRPYLTNAHIPPWQAANASPAYDPVRPRALLLKKGEIKQLLGAKQAQGLTIIPIRVYTNKRTIKLDIALARGKKRYQKKESQKEQDIQRDVNRFLRGKE
jgi:SsrA-binding protein